MVTVTSSAAVPAVSVAITALVSAPVTSAAIVRLGCFPMQPDAIIRATVADAVARNTLLDCKEAYQTKQIQAARARRCSCQSVAVHTHVFTQSSSSKVAVSCTCGCLTRGPACAPCAARHRAYESGNCPCPCRVRSGARLSRPPRPVVLLPLVHPCPPLLLALRVPRPQAKAASRRRCLQYFQLFAASAQLQVAQGTWQEAVPHRLDSMPAERASQALAGSTRQQEMRIASVGRNAAA